MFPIQEQRQNFLEHSVLGAVVEGRKQREGDMQLYAGFHPHFLDALDDACIKVASEKYQVDELIWTADGGSMIGLNDVKLSPTEITAALEDEEDWARVLHRFIENPPMSSIRKSAKKLEIKWANSESLTIEQMIAEDQRYALDESHFCSDFVKQIYVEELHKKLPTSHEHGPWLSYAKLVIQSPESNWSELGWLCERLCDDVISRRGMRISTKLIVNRLSSQPFSSIPKPEDIRMHCMLPGCGRMYIPIRFNFGKVDAVVFYRDIDGQLHLIGLQFTTSQSKHQHSEDEFMSVNVLKQWVPDVVQLQQEGKIVLDFVFVCTALEPKEKECKGTYKELRNGAGVGTVDHISHVIGFDYALEGRANNDVLNTLKDMARLREDRFSNLEGAAEPIAPPDINKGIVFSKTDASRIKRAELDAYAIHAGVNPRAHPTRKSLLDELIRTRVIALEPAGKATQQGRAL